MTKKFFIVIGILVALSIFAYQSDFKSKKLPDPLRPFFVNLADNVINELNVTRVIKQKGISNNDYIDLVLSADELNHISNSMKLFIDEGYIRDQLNPWRKAKIIIDGKKEKVKFKFHGTSVSPLKNDISFQFNLIMKKLGFNESVKVPPINAGVFSLKIKHKKESNYYNLMRRYKLISHHDDAEISTIIINKIASKLGLMAPHGRMVILRINGAELGAYMLVEAHNKEWFEREHQLTNYTILKSNDDWDRKNKHVIAHASDTDLYIENKKINTISQSSPVALGSLELLLNSIRSDDIGQIKRMIDIDYMAKYMALLTITNSNHPISGDNLRYIYNHATGRFKMLFRLEGQILKNTKSISDFNRSLFISPYKDLETLKLFKLLLTDGDFLTKRDEELYKIIKNKKEWESMSNTIFSENMKVLIESNEPIRPIKFKTQQFKKIFENNIKKAEQYLDYNKIFITKYIGIDGKQSLHIINDFTHPIMMKNNPIISNSYKNTNTFIEPSQIDINQKLIYREQEIVTNITNISQPTFENMITHKPILPRNIYFNDAIEQSVFSLNESLQTLKDNYIDYQVNLKNKVITLTPGRYKTHSNIITPYGFNVVIQAGTTLMLSEGMSFLVRGGLNINGTSLQPVVISRSQNKFPFGVIAVAGTKVQNTKVDINYLKLSGGGEAVIGGSLFTGQMSINNADVVIQNSIFENSISDDGINIKYSKVNIKNSTFINNFGDQIDLDYCHGIISNNIFSYKKMGNETEIPSTDGLDISGSKVETSGNTFSNLSDKGISIGENSIIMIKNNNFNDNNLAIAVKDGSKAFVDQNQFNHNNIDISMYVKKKIYNNPSLYTILRNESLNLKIDNGDIIYPKNLQNSFQSIK
jgi:hypothetical protein